MIHYPQNTEEIARFADFMREKTGVLPTLDTKYVGWTDKDKNILMAITYNNFIGSTCMIHCAMADGYRFSPRSFMKRFFSHAFIDLGVKKLIGVVNSLNFAAMRYDTHLGFREEHRMSGLHDDGGDIVFLTMTKEQCRFL